MPGPEGAIEPIRVQDTLPRGPDGMAAAFTQLRESRERIGSILNLVAGDDGVLIQDFTGRVVYANAPAARLLGAPDAATLLRTPSVHVLRGVLIQDEHGKDLSHELPGAGILRGEPASVRTLQITPAGGASRWTNVRTLAMHDDRGGIASSVTVLRDVTEQRLTADFRENLLAIASHDLRGPLAAISMAAAVIARRPDSLQPVVAKLVLQIQASSDRAVRMVHDLLDLAQGRIGGGIPVVRRHLDVGQLVGAGVAEALAAHPEREIDLQCPEGLAACWDGDRIRQVLANLLGNAFTYGAPDTPIRMTVTPAAGAIVLTVQNHGPTIPGNKIATLFEPWVRGSATGATQRSVGLGLYIVKEIVNSHGGTVSATSDAQNGTCFRVTLPA
jgi:signal transduction histidine kinase